MLSSGARVRPCFSLDALSDRSLAPGTPITLVAEGSPGTGCPEEAPLPMSADPPAGLEASLAPRIPREEKPGSDGRAAFASSDPLSAQTPPDVDAARASGQTLSPASPPTTDDRRSLERRGGSALDDYELKARRIEIEGERVYASGAVEIHAGQVSLFADSLEYNTATGDVVADGNVVIMMSSEVIRASRAFFNLKTRLGRIEQASGLMRPIVIFEAAGLEKSAGELYSLERARFTVCTQPVPRWSFSVGRASLERDGYLTMRRAVLNIKKVPVLYLPYLRYPLEKDRATGFLMPRLGLSGPKGFVLAQSFYWAIAPNMDATLGLELYSARGLGAGLEYRYLLSPGTRGKLNLYHFTGRRTLSETAPRSGTIVRLNHSQALPLGFALSADVDYQSSYDFLREYDDDFRRAVVSNRTSQAYLSRSWSRFNLSARASRFETYFSELGDAIVSTSLPQVNFNVFKLRLFSPLFFSLSSSFNASNYGLRSELERGEGRRLSKLEVRPSLMLPLAPVPWLNAAAELAGNLQRYSRSRDPETNALVDVPLTVKNYTFRAELTGPVLYRVYYGRDSEPRLKHIIEPRLEYAYDSPVDEAERIYSVAGYFRLNQLRYGLVNRLLARRDGQAREVLAFGLDQTRYFAPESGPLSRYLVDGRPPRVSELNGFLRLYPLETFSLDVSAGYNPYTRRFSTVRVSTTVGSRPSGEFVAVNWVKSENAWLTGVDPLLIGLSNRHELGAYAGLKLPRLALDLLLDADLNLRDGKLRYLGSRAVYHYQCLDFQFDVRLYYFRVSPEVQVKFSLGLGAIGKTVDFLSGLGF
jgi:lipopolysaccharide assembly outer membrane protein LptD (OstA)